MSTPESEPRPTTEGLQFDHAEYAAEALPPSVPTCEACKTPIEDVYYEAGGSIVCGPCRERLESRLPAGSRVGRMLKAMVLGSVAAAVGAALYYGIMELTGINFGLISVLVGFMVGAAVKSGSGGRGGLFYQFLAVFLTYSSIAAMFAVPGLVQALRDPAQVAELQPAPEEVAAEPAPRKEQAGPKAPEGKGQRPQPAVDPDDEGEEVPMTPGRKVVVIVVLTAFLIAFSYTIPVQIAAAAPISGLIFAFALWEAWKINRKTQIFFNGPFRLSASGAGGGGIEAGAGGPEHVA
ncbi:MAG: hypothetical protein U0790_06910 [Isosphaeraceae bacterium]